MKKTFIGILACALLVWLCLGAAPARCGMISLLMVTGSPDGVYYPVGQAIAKVVAAHDPDIFIQVKSSKGSVHNLNLLRAGKAELAIVQADRACEAYKGTGPWAGKGAYKNLRALFRVVSECVTIVTTDKTGIKKCRDLAGKRVALGAKGSGTRKNALDALACCGLSPGKLGKVLEANPSDAARLLEAGRIDAFFMTSAHPSFLLESLGENLKGMHLVGLSNCDCMRRHFSLYCKGWIPARHYQADNKGADINTCGMWALMVASSKLPAALVGRINKVLRANFAELQKCHQAVRYEQASDLFSFTGPVCLPPHRGLGKKFH